MKCAPDVCNPGVGRQDGQPHRLGRFRPLLPRHRGIVEALHSAGVVIATRVCVWAGFRRCQAFPKRASPRSGLALRGGGGGNFCAEHRRPFQHPRQSQLPVAVPAGRRSTIEDFKPGVKEEVSLSEDPRHDRKDDVANLSSEQQSGGNMVQQIRNARAGTWQQVQRTAVRGTAQDRSAQQKYREREREIGREHRFGGQSNYSALVAVALARGPHTLPRVTNLIWMNSERHRPTSHRDRPTSPKICPLRAELR